jgi:multidrug efflux system outer membrane protein
LDVKQAESIVEGAEVEIRNYEGLIPIQEDLISVLLGIPPAPIPRGKLLQEFELPPEIPTGLPSDLLKNRPDLLQAEQNLISSNALIGVARASFLPVFTITGVDGKQSYDTHDLLKKIATYFDWQLNILQPLYTGGQLTGQLREAEAAFLSNYYTYQQTFLVALQQVSDSLVNHQTAKDVYEIQVKESDAYEEYVRIAKIRYYNGLNDYLTVIDAEQNYFQVQLDTETTRGTIFSSLVDIYTALGQGWDVEADYCEKCDDPSPIWNALPFTRG